MLWQTVERWWRPSWRFVYVDAPLRVPMPGLEWLQLHGLWTLRALFAGLVCCALATTLGRGGRLAPSLLGVLLLVEFAQDASLYLNHHYLLAVLSFVVAMLPPGGFADRAPADALWLVRFTLAVPYVFAAVAKLDPDWLTGRVMDNMLTAREPTFGAFVTLPGQVVWMTYGALVLDALTPWVLWRGPGRAVAWLVLVCFHLANSGLYGIGVFPWLMLLVTPVLLPDDTLRRVWATVREGAPRERLAMALPALVAVAVSVTWSMHPNPLEASIAAWAGALLGWLCVAPEAPPAREPERVPRALPRALLGTWVVLHLTVPLRHLLIPGDVAWTEQGHRYAWRMLLRTKAVTEALVEITDPADGTRWYMRPNELLAPHQATDVLGRPELARAFAREVARTFEAAGHPGAEVRLRVSVSLNGRPPTLLYDPEVDLAHADTAWFAPLPWVLPTPRKMWW